MGSLSICEDDEFAQVLVMVFLGASEFTLGFQDWDFHRVNYITIVSGYVSGTIIDYLL